MKCEGLFEWWRGEDSNLRSLPATDLQSVPFNHSGTPPTLHRNRKRYYYNLKIRNRAIFFLFFLML